MDVARQDVHEFSIFKYQKAINPRFEGLLHETFFLAFQGGADTINPIVNKSDDRNRQNSPKSAFFW